MIELKNIHKTYQMGKIQVKALQGVSLTIAQGEFVAIMGTSGSGKSTLMHIIGLLDKPNQGEYYLCDRKMHELNDDQKAALRNRIVGFVFQQFHLLARMNALENAGLPLIYTGNKQRAREKAKEKICEVGLEDRITHRPNELSGGQQQRVAIARALVNDPLIILADEPTGNLDSKSKEEILGLLKQLNQRGKTVVIVTHENDVAAYAKRIILMRDGLIISDKQNNIKPVVEDAKYTEEVCQIVSEHHKVGKAEFGDFARQALFSLISHKMRSLLSILGILIGVAAVIAMLALGQGAKESIEKQLASLGSNLLVIRPGSARLHGVSMGAESVTRFTFSDVAAISRLSDLLNSVSPSVRGRVQLVYENNNWSTSVEGVGVEYEKMRNAAPAVGRFFNGEELKMREKVVLLGPTVARELFGEANPVGETVKINLIHFKVVGVLRSKGANSFHDEDDTIIIPVTTAMFRLLGKEYVDTIYVEVKDLKLMKEAQDAISQLIINKHRIKKDEEEDAFQIRNMADIKETIESTTKTMSMLLGAIAAISLLVGGIGIMNIMLVSVTERTREIGLRKAIGATNKDIMFQFLVEAILMSCIGGVLGILVGSGIAVLITVFAGWSVKISSYSIILATSFSVIVGVVFGLWPARQASWLDPIEALRYE